MFNSTSLVSVHSAIWISAVLVSIIVVTAFGNILVCVAVYKEKKLQTNTNLFLISLAIADCMVALFVMPTSLVVEILDYYPFDSIYCTIWISMDVLCCTSSIHHMSTMALDRYLTIKFPFKYGRNKTKRITISKIAGVWFISICICSPLLILGILDRSNVFDADNQQCVPFNKSFRLYGSIFAFVIPLAIMLMAYIATIRILKKAVDRKLDDNKNKNSENIRMLQKKTFSNILEDIVFQTTLNIRGENPPAVVEPPPSPFDNDKRNNELLDQTNYEHPIIKLVIDDGGEEETTKKDDDKKEVEEKEEERKEIDNNVNQSCSLNEVKKSTTTGDNAEMARKLFRLRSKKVLNLSALSLAKQAKSKSQASLNREIKSISKSFNDLYSFKLSSSKRSLFKYTRDKLDDDDEEQEEERRYSTRNVNFGRSIECSNLLVYGKRSYSHADNVDEFEEFDDESIVLNISNPSILFSRSTTRSTRDELNRKRIRSQSVVTNVGKKATSKSSTKSTEKNNSSWMENLYRAYSRSKKTLRRRKRSSNAESIGKKRSVKIKLPDDGSRQSTDQQQQQPEVCVEASSSMSVPPAASDDQQQQLAVPVETVVSDSGPLKEKEKNNSRFLSVVDPYMLDSVILLDKSGGPNTIQSRRLYSSNMNSFKSYVSTTSSSFIRSSAGEYKKKRFSRKPSIMTTTTTTTGSTNGTTLSSLLRPNFTNNNKSSSFPSASSRLSFFSSNCTLNNVATNERKALKVLIIIFSVFVTLWCPFFIFNIISAVWPGYSEVLARHEAKIYSILTWLGYSSSMANPVVYTMFNKSFRMAFIDILTCRKQPANKTALVRTVKQTTAKTHTNTTNNNKNNTNTKTNQSSRVNRVYLKN